MKNTPLSYIEINKNHLISNIKQFRKYLSKNTKISLVIKGNAYGHDQNLIAKILENYVDYFQVNSVEEFELLRKVTNKKTMILGYISKNNLSKILNSNSIVSVFSISVIDEINKLAQRRNIIQEICLPVDAHLGREGFLREDLKKVCQKIKASKGLKLVSIYSHFANIEDTTDFSHTQKQINKYKEYLDILHNSGFEIFGDTSAIDTHISATSGVMVYEKNLGISSIVRIGIGAYGLWPSSALENKYKSHIDLKPVLSWRTKIAQIKNLKKGETVGYGLTFKTKDDIKIAVIPQGYADGIDRSLSNCGQVLIHGQRCNILGRVMMNMCVVDVSHIANIAPEDEVVILGKQGNEEITAEEIGAKIGTINYEIITRLSPLLPRIIT